MKNLMALAVISLLIALAGCSGNNYGTSPSLPGEVEGAAGAGAQSNVEAAQIDSHSNGGSSLAAASPYAGDGKSTVQQNINATPFLQASSPMKAGMALPVSSNETLVSRADGTMYSPTDMSPAGVAAGMQGTVAPASNQNSGTKSTAKPATRNATPK